MLLTLPIRSVSPAGARARVVRLGLDGQLFPYRAGQAVFVGSHGSPKRRPSSIANAPEDAEEQDALELLVGVAPTRADRQPACTELVETLADRRQQHRMRSQLDA